jgi:hypothetical protein
VKTRFIVLIFLTLFSSIGFSAEFAVTGTFMGNGKNAKLAYVTAHPGEPFSGKETIVVVLTEKDPGTEAKPEIKAAFGNFGSALILTINSAGDIIGCEVAHEAHEKKPFSSIGKIKTEGFSINKNMVQSKVTTGGPVDAFGQTWAVDLSFHAILPPK